MTDKKTLSLKKKIIFIYSKKNIYIKIETKIDAASWVFYLNVLLSLLSNRIKL